jgi:hypothetical protein
MKLLGREGTPVDEDLLPVLEPQPSGAVRATEAADGIHMAGILHTERHRRQRPDVRAVDPANRASAQDAHEVGPDFSATPQGDMLWHDAPPLDPAPRSIYVIPPASVVTLHWEAADTPPAG